MDFREDDFLLDREGIERHIHAARLQRSIAAGNAIAGFVDRLGAAGRRSLSFIRRRVTATTLAISAVAVCGGVAYALQDTAPRKAEPHRFTGVAPAGEAKGNAQDLTY